MQDLPFPKKLNLRWCLLTLSFIENIWLASNMIFSAQDAEEMLHNAVMRLDYYRPGPDTDLTHLLFASLAVVTRGWVLMATAGFAYAVFKRGHGYDKWIGIYQVMNTLTIVCALSSWIILATKPPVIGQYLLQNDTVQVLDVMLDGVPLQLLLNYMVIVFKQKMTQRERKAQKIYQAYISGNRI